MENCNFDFRFLWFLIPIAMLGIAKLIESVENRGLMETIKYVLAGAFIIILIISSLVAVFWLIISLDSWLNCLLG